jgi:predicted RNase H-like HicB family nuclease
MGTAPRYAETVTPGTEIVFTVTESPEGGFEASAVGHSIHTQAESLDELRAALQDAVRCHFEEVDRPSSIRLHVVRDEVIPA